MTAIERIRAMKADGDVSGLADIAEQFVEKYQVASDCDILGEAAAILGVSSAAPRKSFRDTVLDAIRGACRMGSA